MTKYILLVHHFYHKDHTIFWSIQKTNLKIFVSSFWHIICSGENMRLEKYELCGQQHYSKELGFAEHCSRTNGRVTRYANCISFKNERCICYALKAPAYQYSVVKRVCML